MTRAAAALQEVLLVVDDDESSRALLRRVLERSGHRVVVASSGEEALERAQRERPMLILLDVVMPGMDGYEVCRRLREQEDTRECAVVFLSALDEPTDKVTGLKLGAVDYLTKPLHRAEALARVDAHLTIQRLKRELDRRNAELEHELWVARELVWSAQAQQAGPLLGESAPARRLRERIAAAAGDERPVLILSPGGAGEEAVARAIHHQSERGSRPFLFVDCLGLREVDGESLFGRGSRWELASEGALYLDHVESLPLVLAYELAEWLRSSSPKPRVIARARQEGFAAWEALGTVAWLRVEVPSLAERREDIPTLAAHYLTQKAHRLGRETRGLSERSWELLSNYAWPGNVAELRSVLDCALMTSGDERVEVDASLLESGKRVGSYQLIRRIGAGGMGEVWLARHRLLVQPAAVKLTRTNELLDPSQRADSLLRLEREARVTAGLESLNTVRLYDFGVTDEGSFYYVMEFLEGLDLSTLVDEFGPLPPARATQLIAQACDSLAEAHEQGLVHRDIKPSNLFLTRLGEERDVLKVLDFGLVHELFGADQRDAKRKLVVGTPAFYSPEACQGTPDPRGDIYSLGCTLYYLLTGEYVFEVDNVDAMTEAHLGAPAQPPSWRAPDVTEELDQLVLDCLEKDPARRPEPAELKRRLEQVSCEEPWTAADSAAWWKAWAEGGGERASRDLLDAFEASSSQPLVSHDEPTRLIEPW